MKRGLHSGPARGGEDTFNAPSLAPWAVYCKKNENTPNTKNRAEQSEPTQNERERNKIKTEQNAMCLFFFTQNRVCPPPHAPHGQRGNYIKKSTDRQHGQTRHITCVGGDEDNRRMPYGSFRYQVYYMVAIKRSLSYDMEIDGDHTRRNRKEMR